MSKKKEEILSGLKNWALKNKDIYSVIIAGSQAREHAKADEYSDLDVVVFCKNKHWYDNNPEWMSEIAVPVAYYTDKVLMNQMGNKIFFYNSMAMDIIFLDKRLSYWVYLYTRMRSKKIIYALIPGIIKRTCEDAINAFAYNVQRGFYCLVDKKDYDRELHYVEEKFRHKKDKFFDMKRVNFIVNKFWHHSYVMAIKMYRGDLLSARIECDNGLKICLLQLIELHTKTLRGGEFDTWHSGRRISEWGDPAFTSRLKYIYGHYDLADAWNSLEETMHLFSDVLASLHKLHPNMTVNNPEKYIHKWIDDIKDRTSLNRSNLINNN